MTLSRVAVLPLDVDVLDIDPLRLVGVEGDVHDLMFAVAVIVGRDIGKGIAQRSRQLVEPVDGILDRLGVEPRAFLKPDQRVELGGIEVAKVAFGIDLAEFVARAFLDNISDDEVAAIGSEFGERRDRKSVV